MKTHDHDHRVIVKNGKVKFLLAAVILIGVIIGLNTALFASIGLFDFKTTPTLEELDITITQLNLKLSGAQQGVHFLEGVVASVLFASPVTGLSIGFLKEVFDIAGHFQKGTTDGRAVLDSLMDLGFWTIGGFAGFYAMIPLHGYLIRHHIRGVQDLLAFIVRRRYRKR